jgi:hypothetical protein
MKRRIITQLNSLLTAVLVLGSITVASAQLNMVATGVQTEYTPGVPQTLSISVTNPTSQWIDIVAIEFPAGVTVTNAGGPIDGLGNCGTELALSEICGATVANYRKSNVAACGLVGGSGCGWWNNNVAF